MNKMWSLITWLILKADNLFGKITYQTGKAMPHFNNYQQNTPEEVLWGNKKKSRILI